MRQYVNRVKLSKAHNTSFYCIDNLKLLLMGQNANCPWYNYWKNQGDNYIFNV